MATKDSAEIFRQLSDSDELSKKETKFGTYELRDSEKYSNRKGLRYIFCTIILGVLCTGPCERMVNQMKDVCCTKRKSTFQLCVFTTTVVTISFLAILLVIILNWILLFGFIFMVAVMIFACYLLYCCTYMSVSSCCVVLWILGKCCCCCCRDKDCCNANECAMTIKEDDEAKIRKTLRNYYLNPLLKCTEKLEYPYSSFLQLIVIICISIQASQSAHNDDKWATFVRGNEDTINNVFIGGNPKTLYTLDELYDQIGHIACVYYDIRNTTIGPYRFLTGNMSTPPLILEINKYDYVHYVPHQNGYNIDISVHISSIQLTLNESKNCSYKSQLKEYINGDSIVEIINITMTMTMDSFFINEIQSNFIYCVRFSIKITLNNDYDSGNIPVEVDIEGESIKCYDKPGDFVATFTSLQWADVLSLTIIALHLPLCITDITESYIIIYEVNAFVLSKSSRHYQLSVYPIFDLMNVWAHLILLANLSIVLGTSLKFYFLTGVYEMLDLNVQVLANILFGLGILLHYCALLRILSYFKQFNILLLTLKKAIPTIIRLGLGSLILFMAFLLWGRLVLGPYHEKFSDIFTSAVTLFAILNGDDVYATYDKLRGTPVAIQIFGKVFISVFVLLFVFIILEFIVAIVNEVYTVVTNKQNNGSDTEPAAARKDDVDPLSFSSAFLVALINNTKEWEVWKQQAYLVDH